MKKLEIPANAGKMQETGKFRKGQSGNPRGKISGTKNRATLAAEQLLQGELDNICRRLIEEALDGNIQAIKLVLDRILPQRKNRSIELRLPKLHNSDDALNAISIIVNAVGSGEISPCEGEAASKIIDIYMRALEVHDYEKRLSKLEEKKNP